MAILYCIVGIYVFGVLLFFTLANEHQDLCRRTVHKPLIIGHRGSPGMLPEHTVQGYKLAIKQGADVIECDVAVSKVCQARIKDYSRHLQHDMDGILAKIV